MRESTVCEKRCRVWKEVRRVGEDRERKKKKEDVGKRERVAFVNNGEVFLKTRVELKGERERKEERKT